MNNVYRNYLLNRQIRFNKIIREGGSSLKKLSTRLQPNQMQNPVRTSMLFSLINNVESLKKTFQIFQNLDINLCNIESCDGSKNGDCLSDILVDIECESNTTIEQLNNVLSKEKFVKIIGTYDKKHSKIESENLLQSTSSNIDGKLWFPKSISELDNAQNVLMYGSELDSDHPGFRDPVYRKRRAKFVQIAESYKHGDPIAKVKYTSEEISTWSIVYKELHKLYEKYACKEFLENWPLLEKYCDFREDNIPQLDDVNQFLSKKTGFTLRPAAGYIIPRDFLSALAYRIFSTAQYLRHSSNPFYTPEPDICHELLGHVPLLSDQSFAQFSQEIGLASLGANDKEIDELATLYFFTVEFGLCRQKGEMKVYGAALLSSVAELLHAVNSPQKIRRFDPEKTCKEECIITSFQKGYWYTDSFEEAIEELRKYAKQIQKPFRLIYNPNTQSVCVVNNDQNSRFESRTDLYKTNAALQKICAENPNLLDVPSIVKLLNYKLKSQT